MQSYYLVAYNLLKQRNHYLRHFVTLHLNTILDLYPVNHKSNNMRNFVNSYFKNTQALKGLNTDITVRNPLLSAMILQKMDSELRKRLNIFSHSPSDHANNHGSDDEQ